MSLAANRAYLKTLTDQLKNIPNDLARNTGFRIYMEMIGISTGTGGFSSSNAASGRGFDSGQAAANWKFEALGGNAPPKILWGYGNVAPIGAVGYKTGHGGRPGDQQSVFSQMFKYALVQRASFGDGVSTKFSVYNPISSSFPGFAPGDPAKYRQNALGLNSSMKDTVIATGIARGESDTLETHRRVFDRAPA